MPNRPDHFASGLRSTKDCCCKPWPPVRRDWAPIWAGLPRGFWTGRRGIRNCPGRKAATAPPRWWNWWPPWPLTTWSRAFWWRSMSCTERRRGALVAVDVPDAALRRLATQGFRGVRFHFMHHIGGAARIEEVRAPTPRLAAVGHAFA